MGRMDANLDFFFTGGEITLRSCSLRRKERGNRSFFVRNIRPKIAIFKFLLAISRRNRRFVSPDFRESASHGEDSPNMY